MPSSAGFKLLLSASASPVTTHHRTVYPFLCSLGPRLPGPPFHPPLLRRLECGWRAKRPTVFKQVQPLKGQVEPTPPSVSPPLSLILPLPFISFFYFGQPHPSIVACQLVPSFTLFSVRPHLSVFHGCASASATLLNAVPQTPQSSSAGRDRLLLPALCSAFALDFLRPWLRTQSLFFPHLTTAARSLVRSSFNIVTRSISC